MRTAKTNPVLSIIALAAISMLALNFSRAATTTSTAPARHYYLTKKVVNGNQALMACASGYHFASFAEILDPASLSYNQSLGRIAADDGAGPPSLAPGWVRSGYASNSVASAEIPVSNCNLWTSGASTDTGEVGYFTPTYSNSTNVPAVLFGNLACDNSQGGHIGVWCMEN